MPFLGRPVTCAGLSQIKATPLLGGLVVTPVRLLFVPDYPIGRSLSLSVCQMLIGSPGTLALVSRPKVLVPGYLHHHRRHGLRRDTAHVWTEPPRRCRHPIKRGFPINTQLLCLDEDSLIIISSYLNKDQSCKRCIGFRGYLDLQST